MRKQLSALTLAAGLLAAAPASAEVVSHPSGCPWRAFCGCGVSVRVFGHPVRELYLAANWRRFPSTTAHSGAVAWRYGHVMFIEQMTGPRTAIVYDPNSGGHATRLHERDLRGYRFVEPTTATLVSARSHLRHHQPRAKLASTAFFDRFGAAQ